MNSSTYDHSGGPGSDPAAIQATPRFGTYGVALQLGLALLLGIFVAGSFGAGSGAGSLGPPDHLNRGVVLGLLFAVPGVIAAIGVRGGRPSVLVAAVVMDMSGVLLSFATLVFVVPAVLFVTHAAASDRGPIRLTSAVRAAVLGVALIALVVGAGVVLLTTTESRCWTAYSTPTGTEYRFSPFVGNGVEVTVPLDAIGSGCETGVLSAQGEAIAAVLALGAIVLAGLAGHRLDGPVAIDPSASPP